MDNPVIIFRVYGQDLSHIFLHSETKRVQAPKVYINAPVTGYVGATIQNFEQFRRCPD